VSGGFGAVVCRGGAAVASSPLSGSGEGFFTFLMDGVRGFGVGPASGKGGPVNQILGAMWLGLWPKAREREESPP